MSHSISPQDPQARRISSSHPNTLFHFTNLTGLSGVLQRSGFQLSYAKEKIRGPGTKIVQMAIPMVSFCDLRLSELASHMDKYGSYGVGMSKQWAHQKGLNPVSYINRDSELAESVIKGVEKVLDMVVNHPVEDEEHAWTYMHVMNVQRFIKNYEGPLERNGALQDNSYRFADEKEWRHVLPLKFANDIWPYAEISEVDTAAKKQALNKKIKNELLSFSATDVKYIVVQHDSEIRQVQDQIACLNLPTADTHHLTSRVLSAERIVEDF